MTSDAYTFAGLVLNVVGTILLAVFGWPQPDFTPDPGYLVTTGPSEEARRENEQRERTRAGHLRRSRAAMATVAIGFVLQAIALL